MRKLFIILLFMPLISYSQIDSSRFNKAGTELLKYQKLHTISLGTEGLGLVVLSFGLLNQKEYRRTTTIGLFITLIGLEINANADLHIKKTALYLQGNYLVYRF